MREHTPSRTAAWVAVARGMADRLPPEAQLALDPYGTAFEDRMRMRLQTALERIGVPLQKFPGVTRWILYMQVRTRVIDDALRAFVAGGGRQLVVLGAGYDCRALRLPELAGVRVIEVDHPATQGHKREVLERLHATSPATYVTWNFEERPMAELPAALATAGLDLAAPTFTIWEGVTMYLTEPAIDSSLRAIRQWSAPGSQLAMTYVARRKTRRPSITTAAIKAVVARIGEPWRWAWDPAELPAYLAQRGFALHRDASMADSARTLLPPKLAEQVTDPERRIALAGSGESIAIAGSA
jgi:methyltransferase (TIGR00027 family)